MTLTVHGVLVVINWSLTECYVTYGNYQINVNHCYFNNSSNIINNYHLLMLWSKKQEAWRVKGLGQNCVLLAASKPARDFGHWVLHCCFCLNKATSYTEFSRSSRWKWRVILEATALVKLPYTVKNVNY